MIAVFKAQSTVSTVNTVDTIIIYKTELDIHDNMVVLGKECFIFESTGKTCNVEPFTSELGSSLTIPIADASLAYDFPYAHRTFILIICNALHIKTMQHNLIPPFILAHVIEK